MISSIVSRLVILLFGTLYPAYASYKAVRTKDVREYVKWMMYWIVFALFTCAETFTDVLLSFWFPFYYELKIIVVLWLLSPATRGSSILYRKFVHPTLKKREQEIDEAIMHAKAQGYSTILRLGARGIDYAKFVIMQTAIKGLQNTAQLQPVQLLHSDASSSRTVTDGPSSSVVTGFETQLLNGHMKPVSLDQMEAFQFSDDDDMDYIPPPEVKEETEDLEEEPVEKKIPRPKRRSARSRKQVKTTVIDDAYDFDD